MAKERGSNEARGSSNEIPGKERIPAKLYPQKCGSNAGMQVAGLIRLLYCNAAMQQTKQQRGGRRGGDRWKENGVWKGHRNLLHYTVA